jgi:hypothetical protein
VLSQSWAEGYSVQVKNSLKDAKSHGCVSASIREAVGSYSPYPFQNTGTHGQPKNPS